MIQWNWLSVFLAVIANVILGTLWYGPLFGNQWMKLSGIKKPKKITPQIKKQMMKSYLFMIIFSIITMMVLWLFVAGYNLRSALLIAAIIWLGFFATTAAGTVLWEGKPWKLYFINVLYNLVSLIISAAILVLVR